MSDNETTATAQNVNSAEVWFGPTRTVHGITVATFWEPAEGWYFYLRSVGGTLDVPQTRDLITALSSMLRAVGE